MESLPAPLFCLTLAHSIDDVNAVERLLAEYPMETEQCIPIALRSILETKDLPPVPFFNSRQLLDHLDVLWGEGHTTSPFNTAVKENLIYLVAYFLNRGVDVHGGDDYALRSAVPSGTTNMIKLLLDNGADINVSNGLPLAQAIHNQRIDILNLLLERRANVHAYDDTPIRMAARYGDIPMFELLLASGANIHANNDEILQYSASVRYPKLAQFLREKNLI